MESKRQVGSASSFTSELFGNMESHTTDVFASIFPPSKGVGASWQQQPTGNQQGNTREDVVDRNRDISNCSIANRERTSIFRDERVEPCSLSSSLYYGGQETYSASQSSHNSGSLTTFKKDSGEDDPSGASRGNWWQGSLYY